MDTENESAEKLGTLTGGSKSISDTERELTEFVYCDGFCEEEYHESRTVDVVAGEIIGEWGRPELHVGVKGVDSVDPETETWCIDCAQTQFGISKPAGARSIRETNRYLTPSNVVSFLTGVTVMLIVASVMIV